MQEILAFRGKSSRSIYICRPPHKYVHSVANPHDATVNQTKLYEFNIKYLTNHSYF